MQKILEQLDAELDILAADIDTADVNGSWRSAAAARQFAVIGFADGLTAAKVLTVTIQQATSAAGAGAKALTSGTTTSTGGDTKCAVEFDADDLDTDNSFTHYRVTVGANEGSAKAGGAIVLIGGKRFGP